MKFDVIVADPPWSFKDSLKMSNVARGAQANYATMTISDIKQLPVRSHCNPAGAVLCLWVPSSLLQEGLDTMKAWGFKHKQTYIWVKTKKQESINYTLRKSVMSLAKKVARKALLLNGKPISFRDFDFILDHTFLAFGMGRLFRQTHEICLVGISSNQVYKQLQNKSQRSVCFAQNLKHSAKPEALQDSLEIMFPKGRKLELFARRNRRGWTCLGNEVCNGEDIRDSLIKLK